MNIDEIDVSKELERKAVLQIENLHLRYETEQVTYREFKVGLDCIAGTCSGLVGHDFIDFITELDGAVEELE